MADSPSRKWTALALTGVTVLGLCITLLGCFLIKTAAIIIGMVVMVLPFLSVIGYVCWDEHCRVRDDEALIQSW
jgi:hypothetical protein